MRAVSGLCTGQDFTNVCIYIIYDRYIGTWQILYSSVYACCIRHVRYWRVESRYSVVAEVLDDIAGLFSAPLLHVRATAAALIL